MARLYSEKFRKDFFDTLKSMHSDKESIGSVYVMKRNFQTKELETHHISTEVFQEEMNNAEQCDFFWRDPAVEVVIFDSGKGFTDLWKHMFIMTNGISVFTDENTGTTMVYK